MPGGRPADKPSTAATLPQPLTTLLCPAQAHVPFNGTFVSDFPRQPL